MHVFNRSAIAWHLVFLEFLLTPTHEKQRQDIRVFNRSKEEKIDSAAIRPSTPKGSRERERSGLINVRNDPIRHQLHIPIPILAVLSPTLLLVPPLPMEQQNGKIDHEEVGEDHAPSLGLAGDNVLLVRILEEDGVGRGGPERVRGGVLDDVAGEGGREHVRPAHEPVA